MTFLAPAIPFIASAAGTALGGLLGSKQGSSGAPQANFVPPGFNAGGLSSTFGANGYTVSPSADRTGAVSNIANTFSAQAGDIGNLRSQFAPGYSALRAAQLANIQNNRRAAVGDVSQNLQNRRVLGSSFAQDAINRTAASYDEQEKNAIAQTYLQELEAQHQLIQTQYAASVNSFKTVLDEMNLEAGPAADMTTRVSSALANVANANAKLQADASAGAGKFFGTIGQQLGSGIGK